MQAKGDSGKEKKRERGRNLERNQDLKEQTMNKILKLLYKNIRVTVRNRTMKISTVDRENQ